MKKKDDVKKIKRSININRLKEIKDIGKSIVKIIGFGVACGISLKAAGEFYNPIISVALNAGAIACGTESLKNFVAAGRYIVNRKYDDLAIINNRITSEFSQMYNKNLAKELKLYQHERGRKFSESEKIGLMEIQLIMGIDREKQRNINKKVEKNNDLVKTYSKKYCTKSHTVNIETLNILEDMGYIKILSNKSKGIVNLSFEKSVMDKMLGNYEKENNILGKVKNNIKNIINQPKCIAVSSISMLLRKNNKPIIGNYQNMNRELRDVTFKITNKPIDISDIINNKENLKNKVKDKENFKMRRIVLKSLENANDIITIDNNSFRNHVSYDYSLSKEKIKKDKKENKFLEEIVIDKENILQKNKEMIEKISEQSKEKKSENQER